MTFRILTVCTGNICRSVMAEIILREKLTTAGLDVFIDSAGISAEEQGNPMDPRAARALREGGYPTPTHQAHQIAAGELARYGLILAMTSAHYQGIQRRANLDGTTLNCAENPTGPHVLRMFREFEVGSENKRRRDLDVPDPWYGDYTDFIETRETIENCARAIVDYVRAKQATA